jgi:hypothetical protein
MRRERNERWGEEKEKWEAVMWRRRRQRAVGEGDAR